MFEPPYICKLSKFRQIRLWTVVTYKDIPYVITTEGILHFQKCISRCNALGTLVDLYLPWIVAHKKKLTLSLGPEVVSRDLLTMGNLEILFLWKALYAPCSTFYMWHSWDSRPQNRQNRQCCILTCFGDPLMAIVQMSQDVLSELPGDYEPFPSHQFVDNLPCSFKCFFTGLYYLFLVSGHPCWT